ncbi:PREDICTED: protein JTB [Ficedula albicollis]|uniref:protein JTB n=1 Tax=Ficedula albicollis TaxID=59894 RepID=UPI0007AD7E36|nr:PREDICTED: protein JTB [Ficedula albicollis]
MGQRCGHRHPSRSPSRRCRHLGAPPFTLLAPGAPRAPGRRPPAASPAVATPCWRVEQFVVAQECTRCSGFEMKTIPACGSTGFIERINCASSQRDEYKRCWRFVGSALGVAVAAAALVVLRQRVLDRRALEKVRKQIESI